MVNLLSSSLGTALHLRCLVMAWLVQLRAMLKSIWNVPGTTYFTFYKNVGNIAHFHWAWVGNRGLEHCNWGWICPKEVLRSSFVLFSVHILWYLLCLYASVKLFSMRSPLFIWVTARAWCNENRHKGSCLWTWPSWHLLHSWGLQGAMPCSRYHVSKWSHSISRLSRYKWNTCKSVCIFRLLIAKSIATHLWCYEDTLPRAPHYIFFPHNVDSLHII